MAENEAPEKIWIDDLMIESSRKRGYGRYYFDHHFGNNAPDVGEYIRVRADRAAPDAAHEDERVKDVARCIIATILGFNSLDDLASLPPEHANRKHVEAVVVDAIRELLPVQPAAGTPTECKHCEHEFCPVCAVTCCDCATVSNFPVTSRPAEPSDTRIKDVLAKARETVKPMIDEERGGENTGDLMDMRLDADKCVRPLSGGGQEIKNANCHVFDRLGLCVYCGVTKTDEIPDAAASTEAQDERKHDE